MFIIQGPFPANTSVLVLPSPLESNTTSLRASVQTVYKMSGARTTYVKRRDGRKRYRWDFVVGNPKAKQAEDYFESNSGRPVIVSWRDETFIGYPTLNPFEMSGETGEYFRLTIELEEK